MFMSAFLSAGEHHSDSLRQESKTSANPSGWTSILLVFNYLICVCCILFSHTLENLLQ